MENPMGGLKQLEADIRRKLDAGELPAPSELKSGFATETTKRSPKTRDESASSSSSPRRKLIMRMLDRYYVERGHEPLSDDMLAETARGYDEHFTRAGMPTERIKEVYLEAMQTHGNFKMDVLGYLGAWRRIREAEEGHGSDIERGGKCKSCGGTGEMIKFGMVAEMPGARGFVAGRDVAVDCFYKCEKTTAIAVRGN